MRLSNSHLVNAFLYELEDAVEQDEEFGSLEFDRLDLGSSGFLEKSLEFMIECADDLAQEQNKMQVYQRNVMRQEQVRQSFIQNRVRQSADANEFRKTRTLANAVCVVMQDIGYLLFAVVD